MKLEIEIPDEWIKEIKQDISECPWEDMSVEQWIMFLIQSFLENPKRKENYRPPYIQ